MLHTFWHASPQGYCITGSGSVAETISHDGHTLESEKLDLPPEISEWNKVKGKMRLKRRAVCHESGQELSSCSTSVMNLDDMD
jgi:hypothetical protein